MQSKRAYSQAQATQPIRVRQYPAQQQSIAAPIPRRQMPIQPQQNGYHQPYPVPRANNYPTPRPAQPPTRKIRRSNKKLYLLFYDRIDFSCYTGNLTDQNKVEDASLGKVVLA